MERKTIIGYILLVLIAISFSYGIGENKNLNYLYFLRDDNSKTNKISFEVYFGELIQTGDLFTLDIYYENELKTTCKNKLDINENTMYTKITCEVPKLGDGRYDFKGKITRDGEIKTQIFETEYVYGNLDISMNFDLSKNDKTPISIKINGNREDVLVKNLIPKEVIKELNDDNKDNLIESSLPFEILESDPLIAWNIEKTPVEINYTINKKITEEETKKFRVDVENSKTFAYMKYLIILFIIIMIVFVFKPIFMKKNKTKK